MRLIDADALYETLITGDIRESHQLCYPCKKVLKAIDAQPTVEAISRQQAIDALGEKPLVWDDLSDFDLGKAAQWSDDVDAIKALPSAQPEIVKCRECKHMQKDEIFHQCWCNGREVKYDDFCSHAERRQDD